MLVGQRGEPLQVVLGQLVAGGAEAIDGVVDVLGVPEDEGVEREAERAELVFLAIAVGLAQLAFVAVEDDSGDAVAAFVAVETDAGLAAMLFAVDPAEQVKRLGDAAKLGNRTAEPGRAPAALQDAQQF